MNYAPGVTEFIERSNSILPPDFYTRSVTEQRRLYESLTYEFRFARPAGVHIWHDIVHHNNRAIPIRVYHPNGGDTGGALLFMHGGGFVIGSLSTHDTIVAEMAAKTGLTIIAVDFRLAPEFPFPAAIEDCYGALCGISEAAERIGIDATKIGVTGDSSGANLATAVCLMTRDRCGPPVLAQILISPVLDFTRWRSGGEDAPLLSSGEMVFFTRCYVGEMGNIEHPYVSPLRSARFHDLPPAYIMAAECDSLCIDAVRYAEHLCQCGTPVQLVVEPGLVHACLRARGVSPAVADAFGRICAAARHLVLGEDVAS